MEIANKVNAEFHLETLPRQTLKALNFLSEQNWLSRKNWYLAGGTALTLQEGNRKSVDLDFFTTQANLGPVVSHFRNNKDWTISINKNNTIYAKLLKAKISLRRNNLRNGSLPRNLVSKGAILTIINIPLENFRMQNQNR